MLNEEMIKALTYSSKTHDSTFEHDSCDSIHDCIDWIVVSALKASGNLEGVSDEFVLSCIHWVMDDCLQSLILNGIAEANGVNEDGEITYGVTEQGIKLFEDIHANRK